MTSWQAALGGINISTVIGKLKAVASKNTFDQWVVLGLGISVFLSIYVTVAAMALAVVYLVLTQRLKNLVLYTRGVQYLLALCVLGIIAAIGNNNNLGALIAVALAGCFLVGAFVRSVMTRGLFEQLTAVLCAASLIAFVAAFIQYITFDESERIYSVFTNANYYAAVAEAIVLFAVYKLFRAKSVGGKGFYVAVIVMNAAGLYFSECRTAVFVLFAAVSLMLLLYRRYKMLAVFWAFCALAAALITVLPGIFPRMSQLADNMDIRFAIWNRALTAISQHPIFGGGALAFAGLHFVTDGMAIVHAHNIYLEVLLCFGIAGAVLILAFLQKNLVPIWKMRRNKQDRDVFVLAACLMASVALHGAVDATPFNVQTGLLVMLVLAIAGIQENMQPALIRLPAYRIAYLQDESMHSSRQIGTAKEKAYYNKKSA